MAFDMLMTDTGRKDQIDLDEEYLFMLIRQHNLDCPILSRIWEAYYDSPRIYPNLAKSIVNELDLIDSFLRGDIASDVDIKDWALSYKRLRSFFQEAFECDSMIYCHSD